MHDKEARMSVIKEWLDKHVVMYMLHTPGQASIQIEAPCSAIDSFLLKASNSATFEESYNYSERQDVRFDEKIGGYLRSLTNNTLPFTEFEKVEVREAESYDKRDVSQDAANNTKMKDISQEKTMSKSFGSELKENLIIGGKQAVVGEASEAILDLTKALFGSNPYVALALEDEVGREIIKGLVATLAIYGVHEFPDQIPYADGVKAAASIVLQNTVRETVQPNLHIIRKQLEELGKVGMKSLAVSEESKAIEHLDTAAQIRRQFEEEPAKATIAQAYGATQKG